MSTPLVQFSLVAQSCPTLCDTMECSTPGVPVHQKLLESTQTHVHWVSDAIQPSHPLLSPFFLPSIFPSIRVFSNESALCIRWPKFWSFSFKISPSNEHPGLISFRMDWLDLLAYHLKLCTLWPAFSYTLPLWCWRRLLRVPWTARRSNQSILKEISPSNEYSGLISFRMDWLDLLAVQGTLKSLQLHSSKASMLWRSAFLWSISHIHTWLLEKP